MTSAERMGWIAATDATFSRQGSDWVGKCLICGGPLRFDAASGQGANVEHIVPRALGGDDDPRNLGITHERCNGEKGRHWDSGHWRRANPERYAAILQRLAEERRRRWRDPAAGEWR